MSYERRVTVADGAGSDGSGLKLNGLFLCCRRRPISCVGVVHDLSMGSPVDLTLGCSTQTANHGCHSDILRTGGSLYLGDYLESLRKAEDYLRALEEERRKVEGFKRELPLCIQLLEDGKLTINMRLISYKICFKK